MGGSKCIEAIQPKHKHQQSMKSRDTTVYQNVSNIICETLGSTHEDDWWNEDRSLSQHCVFRVLEMRVMDSVTNTILFKLKNVLSDMPKVDHVLMCLYSCAKTYLRSTLSVKHKKSKVGAIWFLSSGESHSDWALL